MFSELSEAKNESLQANENNLIENLIALNAPLQSYAENEIALGRGRRIPLQFLFLLLKVSQYSVSMPEPLLGVLEWKLRGYLASSGGKFGLIGRELHEDLVSRAKTACVERLLKIWDSSCEEQLPGLATSYKRTPSYKNNSSQRMTPKDARLLPFRKSSVWANQRRFYQREGLDAWTKNYVPCSISSNSFIAKSYARLIATWMREFLGPTESSVSETCHVIEIGAGSCQFGFLCRQHLRDELEGIQLRWLFSDFNEDLMQAQMSLELFQAMLESHEVDFFRFDATGCCTEFQLLYSGEKLLHGSLKGPLLIVCNYVADSLPADLFVVSPLLNAANNTLMVSEVFEIQDCIEENHKRKKMFNLNQEDIFQKEAMFVLGAAQRKEDFLLDKDEQQLLKKIIDRGPGFHTLPVGLRAMLSSVKRLLHPCCKAFGAIVGDSPLAFDDPGLLSDLLVVSECEAAESLIKFDPPQLTPYKQCYAMPVDFGATKLAFDDVFGDADLYLQTPIACSSFTIAIMTKQLIPKSIPDPVSNSNKNLCSIFQDSVGTFSPSDFSLLWGALQDDLHILPLLSSQQMLSFLKLSAYDCEVFCEVCWKLIKPLKDTKFPQYPFTNEEPNITQENYLDELILAAEKSRRHCFCLQVISAPNKSIRLLFAEWYFAIQRFDLSAKSLVQATNVETMQNCCIIFSEPISYTLSETLVYTKAVLQYSKNIKEQEEILQNYKHACVQFLKNHAVLPAAQVFQDQEIFDDSIQQQQAPTKGQSVMCCASQIRSFVFQNAMHKFKHTRKNMKIVKKFLKVLDLSIINSGPTADF